jgi:hypothetical protein
VRHETGATTYSDTANTYGPPRWHDTRLPTSQHFKYRGYRCQRHDFKDNKVEVTDDLDSADVRAPETLVSNLPKLTQVIITNVPQLKLNSKSPEEWALRVRYALAQRRHNT